jgi:uncharacterized membrane protein
MEDWIRKVGWLIAILGTVIGLYIGVKLGVDHTGALTTTDYGDEHTLKWIYGLTTILISLFAGSVLIGLATLMDFVWETKQENKRKQSA